MMIAGVKDKQAVGRQLGEEIEEGVFGSGEIEIDVGVVVGEVGADDGVGVKESEFGGHVMGRVDGVFVGLENKNVAVPYSTWREMATDLVDADGPAGFEARRFKDMNEHRGGGGFAANAADGDHLFVGGELGQSFGLGEKGKIEFLGLEQFGVSVTVVGTGIDD